MLSRSRPELDDIEGVFFYPAEIFSKLTTKRRKRCSSCQELIDIGAEVLTFPRFRYPKTEIEARIYGAEDKEIFLASWYLCKDCGEIFLKLSDAGFCLDIDSNMTEYLKEYWELTGFQPNKQEEIKK